MTRAAPMSAVSIDVIRAAVRTAIENSSVRQVARDVGMSPTGLTMALEAENPRAATMRKLREWYVRWAATERAIDPISVRAALDLLLGDLPARARDSFAERLLSEIEDLYRASRLKVPEWVTSLRETA
jgi:hypothetical protein